MTITNIYQFWSDTLTQWVVYSYVAGGQLRGHGISIDLAIKNLRKKAAGRKIEVLKEPILKPAPEATVKEYEKYFKAKLRQVGV